MEIFEDTLDKVPMHVMRSMHMEARPVHSNGDVRKREGEVLKDAGDAAVERAHRRGLAIVGFRAWPQPE